MSGLFQSRKALMVMLATLCFTVLVALGKIDASAFLDFIKYTLPTWLLAQGVEDAAQKYNPVQPAQSPATVVNAVSVDQTPPPDVFKPSGGLPGAP